MSKCCQPKKCKNNCTCSSIPGTPGAPGKDGTVFRYADYGGMPPSDTIGKDGDVSVDTSDGKYYQKSGGTWGVYFIHVAIKDSEGRVGIGTNTPNADSMLELVSSDKGLLMPRITTANRTGIAAPPAGLVVYDIDLNKIFYYDGSVWVEISTGTATNTNFALDDLTLDADRTHDFDSNSMKFENADGLGVGSTTATVEASALLSLSSITKGLLVPRMTTLQRLAISPADGLIVYDNDLDTLFVYNGTTWKDALAGGANIFNQSDDLDDNRTLSGDGGLYSLTFNELSGFNVATDTGTGVAGLYTYNINGLEYQFTGGATINTQSLSVSQSGLKYSISHPSLLSVNEFLIRLTNSLASGDAEFHVNALGQAVLGPIGATPSGSAILDLQSTSKGMLIPRMTGAQVEAIATPSTGLQVYATSAGAGDITSEGWWGYNGSNWVKGYSSGAVGGGIYGGSGSVSVNTVASQSSNTLDFNNEGDGYTSVSGDVGTSPTGDHYSLKVSNTKSFDGSVATGIDVVTDGVGNLANIGVDVVVSGSTNINRGVQIRTQGIIAGTNTALFLQSTGATSGSYAIIVQDGQSGFGTTTPDASALVDVSSTTQGFLPPRMTTAEMNAIASPATGLMVYDTTTNQWMGNNGTPGSPNWVIIG